MSWRLVHVERKAAQEFIRQHHRHHKPQVGEIVCVGAMDGERLVGVAVIGRPVARMNDDGRTAEITRACVLDGHPNLNSWRIARARRAAQAIGYDRVLSYTLPSEGGASWKAAGFLFDGLSAGGEWDRPSRPAAAAENPEPKARWVAATQGERHGE